MCHRKLCCHLPWQTTILEIGPSADFFLFFSFFFITVLPKDPFLQFFSACFKPKKIFVFFLFSNFFYLDLPAWIQGSGSSSESVLGRLALLGSEPLEGLCSLFHSFLESVSSSPPPPAAAAASLQKPSVNQLQVKEKQPKSPSPSSLPHVSVRPRRWGTSDSLPSRCPRANPSDRQLLGLRYLCNQKWAPPFFFSGACDPVQTEEGVRALSLHRGSSSAPEVLLKNSEIASQRCLSVGRQTGSVERERCVFIQSHKHADNSLPASNFFFVGKIIFLLKTGSRLERETCSVLFN